MLAFLIIGMSFTHRTADTFEYRAVPNQAFTFGEELSYRVHYGWINAARITMKVSDKPQVIDGRETFHIVAKGRTNKSFDWAYKVRDHYESNVDIASIAPLKYFKSVKENKYTDVDLVYYNHANGTLRGKKKNMSVPAYVQDIVSGTYYARTIDYSKSKVGQTYPLNIYLDQEVYNLKFKYLGMETIKTDVGKVKCYKVRPQLVVDRVFKDEDDMTIWISADANRIPVRVQTDIWVGSLKVDLKGYKNLANPFTAKIK
jgi:hypothetical protein